MKYIPLVLLVLIPLIAKSQSIEPQITTHATINIAGRDVSDDGGSISYSIGQVFFSVHHDPENQILEGVQQPLVISARPIVKKENNFKVAAYPNPGTDYFMIEASDYPKRELSYKFMDLQGRLLKAERFGKSGATRVNINSLPAAIYLLRIYDNGKFIKTIKIIKK